MIEFIVLGGHLATIAIALLFIITGRSVIVKTAFSVPLLFFYVVVIPFFAIGCQFGLPFDAACREWGWLIVITTPYLLVLALMELILFKVFRFGVK